MIATIAGHAVAPVAAPLDRIRGSAFSAATGDVSVLSGAVQVRKAEATLPLNGWAQFGFLTAVRPTVGLIFAKPFYRAPSARAPPDASILTAILPLGPPAR